MRCLEREPEDTTCLHTKSNVDRAFVWRPDVADFAASVFGMKREALDMASTFYSGWLDVSLSGSRFMRH